MYYYDKNYMICLLSIIKTNCNSLNIEYESVCGYATRLQLNYFECRGLTCNDILRLIVNRYFYDILRNPSIVISLEITKLSLNKNN